MQVDSIQASSGRIVGACDFGTVEISYVDANNITISGENVRDAGGVIAAGRNNGELEVEELYAEWDSGNSK